MYLRVNKLCEVFLKGVLILMETWSIGAPLVFIFIGMVYYYVHDGYVEADKLYMPLKMKWVSASSDVSHPPSKCQFILSTNRTPFNQSTNGGYCAVLAIELSTSSVYVAVTLTIATLFLSLGMFFNAFSIQFESMFRNMSELASRKRTRGSMVELKQSLIDAIKFHNQAKE